MQGDGLEYGFVSIDFNTQTIYNTDKVAIKYKHKNNFTPLLCNTEYHTKIHTEASVKTRQKKFIASMSVLTFETQKEKLNDK